MNYPEWKSSAQSPKSDFKDFVYQKNPVLKKLLDGKRVALVGPSNHLVGLATGEKIDSYDVVVRIGQFFPIPEKMYEDFGKKTNIVAHSFNQFQIPKCDRKFLNSLDLVMCSMASNDFKGSHDVFFRSLTTDSYNISDTFFYKICKETGTTVNSGFAALIILLQYDIKEIYVTGYSFYNMGKYGEVYYGSYDKMAKDTAIRTKGEAKKVSPKQARSDLHNQPAQIRRFGELLKEYDVITLDDYLKENFKDAD